jgi:hypothetical protein
MFTNMVKIQNNHLHDIPATTMYPETIGPIAGPAKGATVKIANAFPRVCASHISVTRALEIKLALWAKHSHQNPYPEFVNGAAANSPPRKRKMSIDAAFVDSATASWKH